MILWLKGVNNQPYGEYCLRCCFMLLLIVVETTQEGSLVKVFFIEIHLYYIQFL